MPSVSSMLGLITQLESHDITVHQERCVLVRNRNADCLRCAEVCTSGCIHYEDGQLVISPDKCIGCGTCCTVCPTCALEAHNPNDAVIRAQCAAAAQACDGMVCIGCAELLDRAQGLFDEDRVVRVECLGRVEESLLTTLAAQGVSEVVLVHGNCDGCDHATGIAMCQEVLKTQQQLLDAWKSPMKVRLAAKMPSCVKAGAQEYDKARRNAIESGARTGAQMGAVVANYAVRDAMGEDVAPREERAHYVKVMDDGTLPHFIPDRRERLLDALAALGEPEDVMIDTRLWGHVIIDTETCVSCQMCATFCPTGALGKFADEDGTFGVEHYPGDCVKCRCCTNICPAQALELSEEVFAVDMLAGMTDRYEMKPVAVPKGEAHSIWHSLEGMMNTDQVYER